MIFPFTILADSSSTSDAPFESDDFISKLIPNFWDFIIQFAAFIVLLLIVFYFGYKPLKKFIAARKAYIGENISEAEKAKSEGLAFKKENEEGVERAKEEARKIVADAKVEANNEGERIKAEAKESASALLKQAESDIEQAKKKSLEDSKKEMVQIALAASEQVLKRQVNEEDEQKLLEDFVDDIHQGDK
ncbi:MAG: F0F1 ATP synthase subunit B [Bacillota bacterium]|nr:F0F1 ATP synthase subunit B [Bacillota bacterium]